MALKETNKDISLCQSKIKYVSLVKSFSVCLILEGRRTSNKSNRPVVIDAALTIARNVSIYFLTEIKVFAGKSQTETLPSCRGDRAVNTARPRFEIFL